MRLASDSATKLVPGCEVAERKKAPPDESARGFLHELWPRWTAAPTVGIPLLPKILGGYLQDLEDPGTMPPGSWVLRMFCFLCAPSKLVTAWGLALEECCFFACCF